MGDTLVDVENMDPLWGLCAWGLCAWACTCAHGYAQVCHGLNIIRRGMCMSMRKGVCLQVCGACIFTQGCAYIQGCTYVVVHRGMRAYVRMHMCSERNGSRGLLQVYFTRASLLGLPKCSDPHLHCSGPVMDISNLTDHRLSGPQ